MSDGWLHTQIEVAICLLEDAHVIAVARRYFWLRPINELLAQVVILEDLAEFLDSPVCDQELQAGAVAHLAISVITEDADHTSPRLRNLFQRHPCAHALREHGIGR